MKVFYSIFTINPRQAINALEKNAKEKILNQSIINDVQIVVFKVQYLNFNLYSSYTFHPKFENFSFADFLAHLKLQLPKAVISNFSQELKLKNLNLSFKNEYNFDSDFNLSRNLQSEMKRKFHYTVNSLENVKNSLIQVKQYMSLGFERFKFKVDVLSLNDFYMFENFLSENKNVEFIFDFNGCLSLSDIQDLNLPQDFLKRVYWEDPIAFDYKIWTGLKLKGFRLILDQKSDFPFELNKSDLPFFTVAIKPTKEPVLDILNQFKGCEFLITTNMGDELDHRISTYWADKILNLYPNQFFGAGLHTRHFFQNWEQTNLLMNFKESEGWGLDHVMEQRPWTCLGDYNFEL